MRGGIRGLCENATWLALFLVLAGGCGAGSGGTHDGAVDTPAGNDGSQLDAGWQDTTARDESPEDVAQEVGGSDAADDRPATLDASDASNADAGGDDAAHKADGGRDATGDTPFIATWDSPTSIWDQSQWN